MQLGALRGNPRQHYHLCAVALGWGIYRDLTHFGHLFLGADILPYGDRFDEFAAIFLALDAIKTGYHGVKALSALTHLARR